MLTNEDFLDLLIKELKEEALECVSYFDIKEPDERQKLEFCAQAAYILGAKRVIQLMKEREQSND